MGWMCERCGEIKLGNEWICSDPYVQEDHAMDPFDAFTKPTTNQSLLYFVQMMLVITGKEWAEKVPAKLPIYNIAEGRCIRSINSSIVSVVLIPLSSNLSQCLLPYSGSLLEY